MMKFEDYKTLIDMFSFFPMSGNDERRNSLIKEVAL